MESRSPSLAHTSAAEYLDRIRSALSLAGRNQRLSAVLVMDLRADSPADVFLARLAPRVREAVRVCDCALPGSGEALEPAVTHVQGVLFHAPLPAQEISKLLDGGSTRFVSIPLAASAS